MQHLAPSAADTYLPAQELPDQGSGHLLHEQAVHAARYSTVGWGSKAALPRRQTGVWAEPARLLPCAGTGREQTGRCKFALQALTLHALGS